MRKFILVLLIVLWSVPAQAVEYGEVSSKAWILKPFSWLEVQFSTAFKVEPVDVGSHKKGSLIFNVVTDDWECGVIMQSREMLFLDHQGEVVTSLQLNHDPVIWYRVKKESGPKLETVGITL